MIAAKRGLGYTQWKADTGKSLEIVARRCTERLGFRCKPTAFAAQLCDRGMMGKIKDRITWRMTAEDKQSIAHLSPMGPGAKHIERPQRSNSARAKT